MTSTASAIFAGLTLVAATLAGGPASGDQIPPADQRPAADQMPAAGRPRTLVLSLEEALRIAVGESETIWIAESGVLRAMGSEQIARSQLFPQLSGSAQYTRTLRSQFDDIDFGGGGGAEDPEGGDLPFGRENQYTLGLSLSQTVFDAGQTGARIRAAEARRRAAGFDVAAARAQTLLDVTRAYFDALLAERLVGIAEASLAQTEEVLRQTEVARRVGDRSEFELLRARVARDNQLPVLIRRRTERSESHLRLKQLLNVPLEDELTLTTGVEEEVPRFAAAADPSPDLRVPVMRAAEEVRANEAQLSETRGQRLPSVSLTSRYAPVAYPQSGIPEPGDFQEDWTVTLSLSVPILTWGRLRGNERIAEGNLSQAQARLRQAREAAALDARVARNDAERARAILAGSIATAEEARRAYDIAQIRFREGIATQIELSDSRLLLEQAELNRAQALRDLQVARARLALLADLPLGTGFGGIASGAPSGAASGAADASGTGFGNPTVPSTTLQPSTIPGTTGGIN